MSPIRKEDAYPYVMFLVCGAFVVVLALSEGNRVLAAFGAGMAVISCIATYVFYWWIRRRAGHC